MGSSVGFSWQLDFIYNNGNCLVQCQGVVTERREMCDVVNRKQCIILTVGASSRLRFPQSRRKTLLGGSLFVFASECDFGFHILSSHQGTEGGLGLRVREHHGRHYCIYCNLSCVEMRYNLNFAMLVSI